MPNCITSVDSPPDFTSNRHTSSNNNLIILSLIIPAAAWWASLTGREVQVNSRGRGLPGQLIVKIIIRLWLIAGMSPLNG